ncbi:unnamed protein product [marine sediment metagenome]|uniref:Uncharacterized protein n=1 Tax=marine sediment metagenome TaxID=412755 RepID=X1AD13_9ZZZZ
MAFLGDFGKIFLGGSTTADVGGAVGGFLGSPTIGRNIGESLSGGVSRIGEALDFNSPSAGVDSPATVAPVSQTSNISIPGIPSFVQGTRMQTQPQQAFIGGLPSLVGQGLGQAARVLSRPGVGGAVGGFGAGAVAEFFVDQFGQTKKLVITRKMQRDVKKLFMMSGGDFNMTAELYRMATGRSITGEQVVQIITRQFKNQGPYVTKAAVRKTRSTIRKMETLCDLKDRLAPPRRPATRRRATSTTKVLQVK